MIHANVLKEFAVLERGRNVADLYGRYNPDKSRDIWEKLSKAVGSG